MASLLPPRSGGEAAPPPLTAPLHPALLPSPKPRRQCPRHLKNTPRLYVCTAGVCLHLLLCVLVGSGWRWTVVCAAQQLHGQGQRFGSWMYVIHRRSLDPLPFIRPLLILLPSLCTLLFSKASNHCSHCLLAGGSLTGPALQAPETIGLTYQFCFHSSISPRVTVLNSLVNCTEGLRWGMPNNYRLHPWDSSWHFHDGF